MGGILLIDASDFIINRGELIRYVGAGGDVVIPDRVTVIGNGAFSLCYNLTNIVIPDSVTSIGYDAFIMCHKVRIQASAGSYAETYAKENNIPFEPE